MARQIHGGYPRALQDRDGAWGRSLGALRYSDILLIIPDSGMGGCGLVGP